MHRVRMILAAGHAEQELTERVRPVAFEAVGAKIRARDAVRLGFGAADAQGKHPFECLAEPSRGDAVHRSSIGGPEAAGSRGHTGS